ncbi:MAG: YeeE/YedE thiosulfate transporter family protein [Albidovulum sp.]
MQTDWLWGLGGGLIIGTAAAVFLLVNGRVMGASSIFGGLVDGSDRARTRENLAFVAGLIAVPTLVSTLGLRSETHLTSALPLVILAGICVGLGTRLANGCTSGHGVCGISRFSLRGIVATVFYLLGGGLSMVIFRHLLGVI